MGDDVGMKAQQQASGFTLLEVLVVIFIIALTTSLAVVTLGRDDQTLVDQQARQLLEDFSFARDLALNQHRLVGWHPQEQGYQFSLRTSRGQWQAYSSRGLPQRSWQEGVRLLEQPDVLEFAGQNQADSLPAPSLVFFPTGEVTPTTLTLELNNRQRSLQVNARGFELLDRVEE